MTKSALYQVDAELFKPIKGYVKRSALYDGDESFNGYEACKLFAITSYAKRAPTLKLLLKDGSLFSFMPMDCFFTKQPRGKDEIFAMDELVYKNCPDSEVVITSPNILQGKVNCYFHKSERWMDGRYIASLDWLRDNLIMHVIKLKNGQIAILPSHKVKFKEGDKTLEPYRKITRIWEV